MTWTALAARVLAPHTHPQHARPRTGRVRSLVSPLALTASPARGVDCVSRRGWSTQPISTPSRTARVRIARLAAHTLAAPLTDALSAPLVLRSHVTQALTQTS